MKWQILGKGKDIVKILLKNRDIKNSKEFFEPIDPYSIKLKALGIKDLEIEKAIQRIKLAKEKKEDVIIYGDYDADGITAAAILWEALHKYGLNVLPHIPNRFEEGYGLNSKGIENIRRRTTNVKLIITVDNGIVAYEGVKKANELGIDVIVIDHHTPGTKKLNAYSVIHSTETSGAGLSWFFAKEVLRVGDLELAAIGVIADQLPLTDINRSIVKYGLNELSLTKRPGLLALFMESGISKGSTLANPIGTYEVNYIIAPRINAMGRLKHGIESLRLLCTKDKNKALEIAKNIGGTNLDRQKIVERVVLLARKNVTAEKIIVIAGEDYHEGVIGLAAGKLVEEFYRPAIVISKGKEKSKASARSIFGFNIIEAIKKTEMIMEGGGHPMAAGFSIETTKIEEFTNKINTYADELLTDELLTKKIKIDCEINFDQINYKLTQDLKKFEPFGNGNFAPLFCTKNVEILESKKVGTDGKHLKLKLSQNGKTFDAIYFNFPNGYQLTVNSFYSIAYSIEENVWNGNISLQLKIKDAKI